jgi:hypothetical protein
MSSKNVTSKSYPQLSQEAPTLGTTLPKLFPNPTESADIGNDFTEVIPKLPKKRRHWERLCRSHAQSPLEVPTLGTTLPKLFPNSPRSADIGNDFAEVMPKSHRKCRHWERLYRSYSQIPQKALTLGTTIPKLFPNSPRRENSGKDHP